MINKVAVIGHDKTFFSLIEKNLLRIYPKIVCLEFNDGLEVITYCLRNKELPELIFTELFLDKIDGIALTDYISIYLPGIRVVCVVDEFDDNLIGNMAEVGVMALMSKSGTGRLFRIMHSNDGIYRIVNVDLNEIASLAPADRKALRYYRNAVFEKYGITKRESLFVLLNATGLDYSEIAMIMFISRKTVDNLFNSVARKFGVQNRHNLTLFCIRMRLTKFSTVNAINTQNMFYH